MATREAFSRFLQGQSKFTPANVLHAWDHHPDGKLKAGAAEEELVYLLSVTLDRNQIRPSRTVVVRCSEVPQ
jgi:hypothetical protein